MAAGGRQTRPRPLSAPPVTRVWPADPSPVPWAALVIATAIIAAVFLSTPDLLEDGPCAALGVVLAAYGAFLFLVAVLEHSRREVEASGFLDNRSRSDRLLAMDVAGRARLYRDIAVRCHEAADRYSHVGDRLRREAGYYTRLMRKELKRCQKQ